MNSIKTLAAYERDRQESCMQDISRAYFTRLFLLAVCALVVVTAIAFMPATAQAQDRLAADVGDALSVQNISDDLVAGTSLADYYRPVLEQAQAGSIYTLFDMDGNGIPELLVLDFTGTANKDDMHVYTVDENGLRSCGSTSGINQYSVNGSLSGQLYMERVRQGKAIVWAVNLVEGQVALEWVHTIDYSGTGPGEAAVVGDLAAYNEANAIVDLEMGKLGNYSVLDRYGVVEKSDGAQTMWRLYNPNTGEHFYTADSNERNNVRAAGWTFEGAGWVAPTEGDPVYRLYNDNGGEHHYTLDSDEQGNLLDAGWADEGVGWCSDPDKAMPLYREYNPNQFSCNHNYTVDESEHNYLVNLGWKDEGYAWFGLKVSIAIAGGPTDLQKQSAIESLDGWWEPSSSGISQLYYIHDGSVDVYDRWSGEYKTTFYIQADNVVRYDSGLGGRSFTTTPGYYFTDLEKYYPDDGDGNVLWSVDPDGSHYSGSSSYNRVNPPSWA